MLKICLKHSITYEELEQWKGLCPACYYEGKAEFWERSYTEAAEKNIELENILIGGKE